MFLFWHRLQRVFAWILLFEKHFSGSLTVSERIQNELRAWYEKPSRDLLVRFRVAVAGALLGAPHGRSGRQGQQPGRYHLRPLGKDFSIRSEEVAGWKRCGAGAA